MGAIVLASIVIPAGAHAETLLERGTYLMSSIVACGNCHTAPGGPMADKELSGGLTWDEKPFTTHATNITPDGLKDRSDDEVKRSSPICARCRRTRAM